MSWLMPRHVDEAKTLIRGIGKALLTAVKESELAKASVEYDRQVSQLHLDLILGTRRAQEMRPLSSEPTQSQDAPSSPEPPLPSPSLGLSSPQPINAVVAPAVAPVPPPSSPSPPPPIAAAPASQSDVKEPASLLSRNKLDDLRGERRKLRERRVPESPLGRAVGFASLGASIFFGTLGDNISRAWSPPSDSEKASGGKSLSSSVISEANAERLAEALCRMRGAALKIGQMLSIQDENILPPQIQSALERVRQGADVMPRGQLERVLANELGSDWQGRVAEFDYEPFAAASIGQVHRVTTLDGRVAAMKVQYPGVSRSIESDVDNLMRLISIANVLPKGLYVESAVKVAKRELALECDYTWEQECQEKFRALVESDPQLSGAGAASRESKVDGGDNMLVKVNVPRTIPELCTSKVMTSEWVRGVAIDKVASLPQQVRDRVGSTLLTVTLRELFEWRLMQTDPNFGNFLYDQEDRTLHLIDFGASKYFEESFVFEYLEMVHACSVRDAKKVVEKSIKLGFLTGDESKVMTEAHCEAGFVVGVPFGTQGVYDFGSHQGMTARVGELGATMLKHRLKAPPEDSYALHRKLSGAFLACMKLKARVKCRDIFLKTYNAVQSKKRHSSTDSLNL